jgi:hypothetical protein
MSGDFDPRDIDSRERDDGIHDREDEWLTIGRGPGSAVVRETDDAVRERDDERREDRDREPRGRDEDVRLDPRDVFMRDLDLPRGLERELVHDRDRDYTLNGRESRTFRPSAPFGSFRNEICAIPRRRIQRPTPGRPRTHPTRPAERAGARHRVD